MFFQLCLKISTNDSNIVEIIIIKLQICPKSNISEEIFIMYKVSFHNESKLSSTIQILPQFPEISGDNVPLLLSLPKAKSMHNAVRWGLGAHLRPVLLLWHSSIMAVGLAINSQKQFNDGQLWFIFQPYEY